MGQAKAAVLKDSSDLPGRERSGKQLLTAPWARRDPAGLLLAPLTACPVPGAKALYPAVPPAVPINPPVSLGVTRSCCSASGMALRAQLETGALHGTQVNSCPQLLANFI